MSEEIKGKHPDDLIVIIDEAYYVPTKEEMLDARIASLEERVEKLERATNDSFG